MAIFDNNWYLNYGNGSSTGYYAVAQWTALTMYPAGSLVRQLATPAVGSERIFVQTATVTFTSGASEPAWVLTYGGKTTDATAVWYEITGRGPINGDQTLTWTNVKNKTLVVGQMIYDSGSASVQIVTTAGTTGNGATPSFSATAGTTTADNTVTWTSLGLQSNFTLWGAPHARLATIAAAGFMASGNTCYIATAHAETQASALTVNPANGSVTSPLLFYTSSTAAAPPTSTSTGSSVSTTGASNMILGASGTSWYIYGVTFNSGSGANNSQLQIGAVGASNPSLLISENCTFNLTTSNAGSQNNTINMQGVTENDVILINPTFTFGATSQQLGGQNASVAATIINGTIAQTGSVPTVLFGNGAGTGLGLVLIKDTDLSAIIGTLYTFQRGGYLKLQNCKLGSGVTISTGANGLSRDPYIQIHNCDSTSTNYRYYYATVSGTIQQETTVVRTGGATDGVTPISWNITTTSKASFAIPFVSEDMAIFNTQTGSALTATLYLTSNSTLTNQNIWIEIEYLGSNTSPLGSTINTRVSLLGTPSTLTGDTSTWGGSISNKYKITTGSFTPQMKGPIKLRIYTSAASTTIYCDPQIEGVGISIARSFIVPGFGYINEESLPIVVNRIVNQYLINEGDLYA